MSKFDFKNMSLGKKTINIAVVVAALVVVALILQFGFNGTKDASSVSVAGLFNEKEGMVKQGTVETKEVNVNSKVPGRVINIFVEAGQEVKEGDPLVEISSDELQAKKQQAEAAVAQAEAALKAAKEQLTQAQAGVKASQGLVEQAQAGVKAYEGKVQEAKAGVAAAEKQHDAIQSVSDRVNNGTREQVVAQAQAAVDLLQDSYDRVAELVEKGAVAEHTAEQLKSELEIAKQALSLAQEGASTEVKDAATSIAQMSEAGVLAANTRVDQANAALAAAQAQLTQAMAGVDSSNALLMQAQAGVEAREGLVEQAKGAVAEVNAYLESVVIKAPMDGVVTSLNSEVGELVSSGTQIAIVSNLSGTWVEVNVKETELGKVAEGQMVNVRVPAYPEQVFTGKVTTVNAQPDFAVKRATNDNGDFDIVSFGVKVKLDNFDELLRPGMSAYIQFTGDVNEASSSTEASEEAQN